jgi:hypothetical protein
LSYPDAADLLPAQFVTLADGSTLRIGVRSGVPLLALDDITEAARVRLRHTNIQQTVERLTNELRSLLATRIAHLQNPAKNP